MKAEHPEGGRGTLMRWNLTNVLVAGRRVSGLANGRTAKEAVRHFAAVKARELGADIGAAIARAVQDPHKKVVSAAPARPVARAADALLPTAYPAKNYTDWPAMQEARVRDLSQWLAGSKVVGPDGQPRRVYRGEHGADTSKLFQSRRGALSFGGPKTASTYAESPNDLKKDAHAFGHYGGRGSSFNPTVEPAKPRVIPAYLQIKNPIINDHDDPFIDFDVLEKALGRDEAIRIALRFAGEIENTNNWMDTAREPGEKEPLGTELKRKGITSVAEFLRRYPQRVGELYCLAYPVLDDPGVVTQLRRAGYDGAIHGAYGGDWDEPEYKVFSRRQARPAIGARAAIESASP